MDEAILYTYSTTGLHDAEAPRAQRDRVGSRQQVHAEPVHDRRVGQWLKWAGQKHVLPHVRPCREPRSDALAESEACLISRNPGPAMAPSIFPTSCGTATSNSMRHMPTSMPSLHRSVGTTRRALQQQPVRVLRHDSESFSHLKQSSPSCCSSRKRRAPRLRCEAPDRLDGRSRMSRGSRSDP